MNTRPPHVLAADLAVKGQSTDAGRHRHAAGAFCLVGDGICVGRDSASPVTHDYAAPFPFTGGTIDKVVVDVTGDRYIDHEKQVAAWFSID